MHAHAYIRMTYVNTPDVYRCMLACGYGMLLILWLCLPQTRGALKLWQDYKEPIDKMYSAAIAQLEKYQAVCICARMHVCVGICASAYVCTCIYVGCVCVHIMYECTCMHATLYMCTLCAPIYVYVCVCVCVYMCVCVYIYM